MGNAQATKYRAPKQRNNFSFDTKQLNQYSLDKIKSSNELNSRYIGNNETDNNRRQKGMSLDMRQSGLGENYSAAFLSNNNKDIIKQSQSRLLQNKKSRMSLKQQNLKLQKLTKNNDELRSQLIQINKLLSKQLEKKKMPILMNQHGGKSLNLITGKKDLNNSNSKQGERSVNKESGSNHKDKIKILALKKQLQNGYNQISMYKKQIQEYKKNEPSKNNQMKLQQFQDKIAAINIEIEKYRIQVDSSKSVVNKQATVIKQFQDELNGPQVKQSIKEINDLKERLKVLKNISRKKEKEEKMRHQILIQLQRKVRQQNGDYLPEFKNYSYGTEQTKKVDLKQKNANTNKKPDNSNKKPANQKQFRYLPSKLQIQQVQLQLKKAKQAHQEFHKTINLSVKKRNDLKQERQQIEQKLGLIQKKLENFHYKKDRYMQIIMGNMTVGGEGGNMDDLFSVMENGEGGNGEMANDETGADGMIMKGEFVQGQIQFNDRNHIKNYDSIVQKLKIITVNIWLNDKSHIVGIQFFYTDGNQFYLGKRSQNNKQVQQKSTLELQQGDYVKNVMGTFNKKTKYLEFLLIESAKGKVLRCGKESFKNNNFNIRTGKAERLVSINGSCVFDGSFWRINRLGFVIKK